MILRLTLNYLGWELLLDNKNYEIISAVKLAFSMEITQASAENHDKSRDQKKTSKFSLNASVGA